MWPARPSEPGVLYAGVDPAGFFRSEDGGVTWHEVRGLNRHPTRPRWMPGAGGLTAHTILLDPADAKRMFVAISAAGVFRTQDGGKTWLPRNKGTRADFLPNKFPEFGQCVHKMVMAPGVPDLLYQQNHCGMYRSENAGDTWTDISRDLRTIWVVPLVGAEFRACREGCLAAYRSTNGGRTWQKQTRGLPTRNAYVTILREAMSTDTCDPAGVYFGTQTGQVFFTRNEGKE